MIPSFLKSIYLQIREPLRLNPHVSKALYSVQSLFHSNFGEFRNQVIGAVRRSPRRGEGVALCCRIRDEARYLAEFVEYYLAAGVDHFFFYEKLSTDNFAEVLAPYIRQGIVTLFSDWPNVPISPSAEQDCILRTIGRFEWVGFVDADEFVVVKDGCGIGEFLSQYREHPAVALHWRVFGSNGHAARPSLPVIAAYTRRAVLPNRHVKCFVQPAMVANYRNPHSWFYKGMRGAVNELRQAVTGSISAPTAELAWINHYHHKSDEDYFEKSLRVAIANSMPCPNRSPARHIATEALNNAVEDQSAMVYWSRRSSKHVEAEQRLSYAGLHGTAA